MPLQVAHFDFPLFAGGLFAIFLAARLLLRRYAHKTELSFFAWLALIPILIVSWFWAERAGKDEKEKIADLVASNAPTYARELGRMGHANIPSDASPDDPAYQRLAAVTVEWMRDNRHAHDIYTIRRKADGTRVFVVDADTDYNHDGVIEDRERGAKIGQNFELPDPALDRALLGEKVFDFEPLTDQWGTWVSAWAPIFDEHGNVDAVVGVDFDASEWMAAVGVARRASLTQMGLVALIVLASFVAISVLRHDLALRRAIEAELRHANDRWKLIAEQMPLPFVEFTPEGTVIAWNPAAERVFGFTASEMIGQPGLPKLVPPEAQPTVETAWARLLKERTQINGVNENVTKDGSRITCEWFNSPVVDRSGTLLSIVSLAQDLTERLSLQRQVLESQKLTSIGVLAAGVAHDFNNMLTVIMGHTGMILLQDDLPPQVAADVDHIGKVAERAAQLTQQLLSFSRQRPMFPTPVGLNKLVRETADLLNPTLGNDLRIICDLSPDVLTVEVDASMIEQALTNLAMNARDAMPRGGTLTFATRRVEVSSEHADENREAVAGPAICLSVSDTGTGIAAEKLPRIFEPFYTTKEVGRGTGLGLSAVHGIVKQHRGWIEVRTEVGVGTRFEIYLAPWENAVELAAPADLGPRWEAPRGGTVLLVDDDAQVRSLARESLIRGGFEVLEASDGIAAEHVWSRDPQRIDLLCTDIVMPNSRNGRELAALLLKSRPELPIVYCSGYSDEFSSPDFCASKRQVFVQKPFTSEGLLAAVRRCQKDA